MTEWGYSDIRDTQRDRDEKKTEKRAVNERQRGKEAEKTILHTEVILIERGLWFGSHLWAVTTCLKLAHTDAHTEVQTNLPQQNESSLQLKPSYLNAYRFIEVPKNVIKWGKILRLITKRIKKAHLCEQKRQVLKSRAGNNWFDYTVKYSFTLQTELVTNSNTSSIQAHVLQLHSSQKNKCQLLLNRAQKNPPTLSPRWLYLRWLRELAVIFSHGFCGLV